MNILFPLLFAWLAVQLPAAMFFGHLLHNAYPAEVDPPAND